MPKSRFNYVVRRDAPSTSQTGTAVYDLSREGFLQQIQLSVACTPTAVTDPAVQVKAFVKAVTLRSGGEVVFSLRGNELKAFESYDYQSDLASTELNEGGVEGTDTFVIPFERVVNGRLVAPDLTKWNHPQLVVEWDASITKTDFGMFVDADTAPVPLITILEYIYEGTGKHTHGYLKVQEVKTLVMAASATFQTTIAINEPLEGVLITGGYGDTNFSDDHTEIKFNFGGGAWVPLDLFSADFGKWQEAVFGNPFTHSVKADIRNAKNLDLHMGRVIGFAANGIELASTYSYTLTSNSAAIPKIGVNTGADVAQNGYERASFSVRGFLPYHSFFVPMWALLGGDSDTVDPSMHRDLVITTVSGSSANTSSRPKILARYLVTK